MLYMFFRSEWHSYYDKLTPGALSICLEKPVVPVGNQMERAFPLEIFRKKRNTFRGIPLFPPERPVFPNKWKAPLLTQDISLRSCVFLLTDEYCFLAFESLYGGQFTLST